MRGKAITVCKLLVALMFPQNAHFSANVEGLRAVAVLLVLAFHVGVESVSGGFIGVDVFFVISGFLITGLLVREYNLEGSVSLGRFWQKRFWRLMPALVAVCALTLPPAFLLFSPTLMESYSASLGYAVANISNWHFWLTADYFDGDALDKPLLHTWTLGVEWQFYAVWPLMVLGCLRIGRRKLLGSAIVVLALGSFALIFWARVSIERAEAATYFLPQFRVFEFLIGSGLAIWRGQNAKTVVEREVIGFGGLLAIFAAVFLIDGDTNFPGIWTLLPVIAAGSIIYAGDESRSLAILRTAPMRWLGQMSYSIYLVHWPLIVFWKAVFFTQFSFFDQVALATLSIGLGGLLHYTIERPLRYPPSGAAKSIRVGSFAALAVGILVFSVFGASSRGLPERIPSDRWTPTFRYETLEHAERYCSDAIDSAIKQFLTCYRDGTSEEPVYVWGDSHARHLTAGMATVFPTLELYIVSQNSCVPQSGFDSFSYPEGDSVEAEGCRDRNQEVLNYLKQTVSSRVVLTSAKRGDPEELANATNWLVSELVQVGHTVVVLEDFVRPGVNLTDCWGVPSYLIEDASLQERCVGDAQIVERDLNFNAVLRDTVSHFLPTTHAQCGSGDVNCAFSDAGGLWFSDHHHLSDHGSIEMISRLKNALRDAFAQYSISDPNANYLGGR